MRKANISGLAWSSSSIQDWVFLTSADACCALVTMDAFPDTSGECCGT